MTRYIFSYPRDAAAEPGHTGGSTTDSEFYKPKSAAGFAGASFIHEIPEESRKYVAGFRLSVRNRRIREAGLPDGPGPPLEPESGHSER